MNLFKNRSRKTIAELEEYYANKSSSTGKAWIMAFLSLLITVAVLAVLFFGGRWVYRTIANNGDSNDVEIVGIDTPIAIENGGILYENDEVDDLDLGAPAVEDNANETEGTVSEQAVSTSQPNTDRIAITGDSEVQIPNTGAGEIAIMAPLIAAVFGYFVSRKKQLKNS